MKLGRRQPRMDPMHAEFVVNVGIELDDAMRLYRDALDADGVDGELRGRLLTAARQAAVIHRTALWLLPDLRRGLPEPLWPFAAVRALDRVAYGDDRAGAGASGRTGRAHPRGPGRRARRGPRRLAAVRAGAREVTDPRVHELLDEPFALPASEPASGVEEELMRVSSPPARYSSGPSRAIGTCRAASTARGRAPSCARRR